MQTNEKFKSVCGCLECDELTEVDVSSRVESLDVTQHKKHTIDANDLSKKT